jgi:hypothetical protein
MMLVYIKAYRQEVEVKTMVIYGSLMKMQAVAKMIQAIGMDPQKILTVNATEEIEALKEHYCVFFCNKFKPEINCLEFSCVDVDHFNITLAEPTASNLANMTGISAFKNLHWSEEHQIWVHYGVASVENQHTPAELAGRFTRETIKWMFAGRPTRTQEQIDLLHQICQRCSEFVTGNGRDKCNLCGCNINKNISMFNKLAMATTSCPLDPPKWSEETAVSEEDIRGHEAKLIQAFIAYQKAEYPEQDGQICDCE